MWVPSSRILQGTIPLSFVLVQSMRGTLHPAHADDLRGETFGGHPFPGKLPGVRAGGAWRSQGDPGVTPGNRPPPDPAP